MPGRARERSCWSARPWCDGQHDLAPLHAFIRFLIWHTQVEVAAKWGRPQSQVSRLEADPLRADLGTILAYIQALGRRLTVEAEIGGQTYTVDLADAS